jgi:hypothetical protein
MASLPFENRQTSRGLCPSRQKTGSFYRNSPIFSKTDLKTRQLAVKTS